MLVYDFVDFLFESGADVSVENSSGKHARYVLASDLVTVADITSESGNASVLSDKRKSITVAESDSALAELNEDAVTGNRADFADFFSHGFGRIHSRPFFSSPVKEKFSISSVECL